MTDANRLRNLIFDTNNGILMSICCNLIYDPTDPFCQKNASNLMEFFNVHDKMDDLFIWAFSKEYLEKSLLYITFFYFHNVLKIENEVLNTSFYKKNP